MITGADDNVGMVWTNSEDKESVVYYKRQNSTEKVEEEVES